MQAERIVDVIAQFRPATASDGAAVDVGANEILARALEVLGVLALETGQREKAGALMREAGAHFDRVDQVRHAYRCHAVAIELDGTMPSDLIAALEASGAGAPERVEAQRLHLLNPRKVAPGSHWKSVVVQARIVAGSKEHRWTDTQTA